MAGRDLGIDLGTANVLVHVRGKGIVVNEPSVLAVNKQTNTVVAVGEDAKAMLGRTPGDIVAIRPIQDGVIADFESTQDMLKHFIQTACAGRMFPKPRVLVCIPSGITEVEKRAVEEAVLQAGARETYLIEEPMAAAMGAGLPVDQPTGCMVVDIGGGTTEVAVLSLGGIVTCESLRVAGDALDGAIMQYMKKNYNLMIGEQTAEDIKLCIGSAFPLMQEEQTNVMGRDLVTGLPKTVTVQSTEIREAMMEPISNIIEAIRTTLEKAPPELASDMIDRGITLTGGGALLRGLDQLVSEQTGLPVYIANTPMDCVAMGTAPLLEEIGTRRRTLFSGKKGH